VFPSGKNTVACVQAMLAMVVCHSRESAVNHRVILLYAVNLGSIFLFYGLMNAGRQLHSMNDNINVHTTVLLNAIFL